MPLKRSGHVEKLTNKAKTVSLSAHGRSTTRLNEKETKMQLYHIQKEFCMQGKPRNNLTGKTFCRLTVLEFVKYRKKSAIYLCRCTCGNERFVTAGNLMSENTRSCGCLRSEHIISFASTRWDIIRKNHSKRPRAKCRFCGEIFIKTRKDKLCCTQACSEKFNKASKAKAVLSYT